MADSISLDPWIDTRRLIDLSLHSLRMAYASIHDDFVSDANVIHVWNVNLANLFC
jgi:hypothetical protein